MSIFDKLKKATATVKGTGNALKTAADAFGAFSANPHPYQSMMGNPTTSRGSEGQLRNYHYEQEQSEFAEDEEEDIQYTTQIVEREVSSALMESFRKRATMKTDMIILRLQKNYLLQKVLAKLVICNEGDELIAKKHEDLEDDEIKDLPKEVQKILRNQKHIQAIEAFSVESYFKESCIEYFTMEFEEDYRNGLTPDFKDINPIELLTMKMQEPFNNLMADYAVDYALRMKPEIMKGVQAVKAKYIDGAIKKVAKDNTPEPQIIQSEPQTPLQNNLQIEFAQTDSDINDKWAESEKKRLSDETLDANDAPMLPILRKEFVVDDEEHGRESE